LPEGGDQASETDMTIDISKADGVATVTLNRPDKKNAITMAMREQLWTAFEDIAEDDAIRAVVLAGAGGDFCAGIDVGEMGSGGVPGSMMRMRRLHRIGRAIANLKKPVVTAIEGVCVGVGWSYALCADIVVAGPSARFGFVFNKIGLAPDGGAAWLLSRQVGLMRAKEIMYSARLVGADEALSLGLILEKVEAKPVLERAQEIARSFAERPTLAIAMAKRQFELAPAMSYNDFLEHEFAMQPLMTRTEDHHEGVQAFKERRPPVFKGA